jgi:hypothetical protein
VQLALNVSDIDQAVELSPSSSPPGRPSASPATPNFDIAGPPLKLPV